jgi:class 3 adenylate cyclase/tetratricopeptide (TPR) repeat protein
MDLGGWLRSLGLEQYEAAFRENGIDLSVLPDLTDQDLEKLGVLLGHRRKLLRAIANLEGAEKSAPAAVAAAPAAPRPLDTAERRHVTVMFSDLVGSTALSARMDPEDLREVISAYHKCAAEIVRRFGGFVSQYLGDGMLVYFGYPQAHEDDAERSVRAALELVTAVGALKTHAPLQARVGIATGLVVVGDLVDAGGSQERGIIGETPNLAARLQGIAQPNMVVIGESTRRLLGNLFELEDLGARELKGITGPVPTFAVLRTRSVESRFEALHASGVTALVGREEESELLLRRWARAKTGEGQVVLLSGEAGIGKSRLTAALQDNLKDEAHVCLRYFCEAHHQGSALQPFVAQLQHAAGFTRDDTPAEKQAKLGKLLAPESRNGSPEVEVFANLLGSTDSGSLGAADRDPQRQRRRTLTALIERLDTLASRSPVLMLLEDAHWADPTSIELLTLTIERLQSLPILLIITFRPDYQPPWAGQPHVTMLTLNRFSRREREMLVDRISGGKALPPELLKQIVERTDGVPLFVEELTKAVLESEQLRETGDRYVLDQPTQELAIPTTLQASLMARVDRLGSAREVLQIGAAIGREFSYEILATVADLPDAVLQDALIRLTEAELVSSRGMPPNAVYTFKHALIQDSTYSTMLRARRQKLHSAIAVVLERQFQEVVNSTPEVIAQQFERAGQNEKAIQYWQQAGERDLRRFAMKESIAHYANALRLVTTLPESPERMGLELAVCLRLGLAQLIGFGPSAKESTVNYERALTLARVLGSGRERFLAAWGVWFHTGPSGRATEALALAEDLVTIARELGDTDLLLEAYHARAPGLLWTAADFPAAKETAQEVVRLYDRERHRDHAYYFGGHDSRVCAQAHYAITLWGLGFPDQALQMAWRSIEDGRASGHAFSHAHGLGMGSVTFLLLSDENACQAVVNELYPIAERNKFPWSLAYMPLLRGWLNAQQENRDAGIEQMLEAAESPIHTIWRPMILTLIAEQQLRAVHLDAAIATLDRAMNDVQVRHVRFYEPEIIRLRGAILLAQASGNAAKAEAAFRQAMAIAIQQSCRAIELRAAVSLTRLLSNSDRKAEARASQAPPQAERTRPGRGRNAWWPPMPELCRRPRLLKIRTPASLLSGRFSAFWFH